MKHYIGTNIKHVNKTQNLFGLSIAEGHLAHFYIGEDQVDPGNDIIENKYSQRNSYTSFGQNKVVSSRANLRRRENSKVLEFKPIIIFYNMPKIGWGPTTTDTNVLTNETYTDGAGNIRADYRAVITRHKSRQALQRIEISQSVIQNLLDTEMDVEIYAYSNKNISLKSNPDDTDYLRNSSWTKTLLARITIPANDLSSLNLNDKAFGDLDTDAFVLEVRPVDKTLSSTYSNELLSRQAHVIYINTSYVEKKIKITEKRTRTVYDNGIITPAPTEPQVLASSTNDTGGNVTVALPSDDASPTQSANDDVAVTTGSNGQMDVELPTSLITSNDPEKINWKVDRYKMAALPLNTVNDPIDFAISMSSQSVGKVPLIIHKFRKIKETTNVVQDMTGFSFRTDPDSIYRPTGTTPVTHTTLDSFIHRPTNYAEVISFSPDGTRGNLHVFNDLRTPNLPSVTGQLALQKRFRPKNPDDVGKVYHVGDLVEVNPILLIHLPWYGILSEQAKTVFSSSSTAPIDFFELGVIPAGTDDGHFTHELVLEFISNDGSTMTKKVTVNSRDHRTVGELSPLPRGGIDQVGFSPYPEYWQMGFSGNDHVERIELPDNYYNVRLVSAKVKRNSSSETTSYKAPLTTKYFAEIKPASGMGKKWKEQGFHFPEIQAALEASPITNLTATMVDAGSSKNFKVEFTDPEAGTGKYYYRIQVVRTTKFFTTRKLLKRTEQYNLENTPTIIDGKVTFTLPSETNFSESDFQNSELKFNVIKFNNEDTIHVKSISNVTFTGANFNNTFSGFNTIDSSSTLIFPTGDIQYGTKTAPNFNEITGITSGYNDFYTSNITSSDLVVVPIVIHGEPESDTYIAKQGPNGYSEITTEFGTVEVPGAGYSTAGRLGTAQANNGHSVEKYFISYVLLNPIFENEIRVISSNGGYNLTTGELNFTAAESTVNGIPITTIRHNSHLNWNGGRHRDFNCIDLETIDYETTGDGEFVEPLKEKIAFTKREQHKNIFLYKTTISRYNSFPYTHLSLKRKRFDPDDRDNGRNTCYTIKGTVNFIANASDHVRPTVVIGGHTETIVGPFSSDSSTGLFYKKVELNLSDCAQSSADFLASEFGQPYSTMSYSLAEAQEEVRNATATLEFFLPNAYDATANTPEIGPYVKFTLDRIQPSNTIISSLVWMHMLINFRAAHTAGVGHSAVAINASKAYDPVFDFDGTDIRFTSSIYDYLNTAFHRAGDTFKYS